VAERPALLRRLFSAIARRQRRKYGESVLIAMPQTPRAAISVSLMTLRSYASQSIPSLLYTDACASRKYIVMYTASVKNLMPSLSSQPE
jgi:hypothetical protein